MSGIVRKASQAINVRREGLVLGGMARHLNRDKGCIHFKVRGNRILTIYMGIPQVKMLAQKHKFLVSSIYIFK